MLFVPVTVYVDEARQDCKISRLVGKQVSVSNKCQAGLKLLYIASKVSHSVARKILRVHMRAQAGSI